MTLTLNLWPFSTMDLKAHYFLRNKTDYTLFPLPCCEDPKSSSHSLEERQICCLPVVIRLKIPNFWDCLM